MQHLRIDNGCLRVTVVGRQVCWEGKLRLPDAVIDIVKRKGVRVYFASRNTTRVWNQQRISKEPLRYGGWYWMRSQKGRVTEMDEDGPFRSQSAAIRDAFVKLQLRIP